MAGSPCDWPGNGSSQSMQWSAQDPVRFLMVSQTRSIPVCLFTQSHAGLPLTSAHSLCLYVRGDERAEEALFFLNQMDRLTSCAFSGLIQARGGVVPWQGCLICIWHTAAQSSAHLRSGSYSIHHINQTPVVVDLNEKMHGSPKRWLIVTDPADPNESF